MAKLIVKTGDKAGMEYEVKEGVVLGREAGVDIPLLDARASRKHLKFVLDEGKFAVEDLGSTNGTFLNGSRVTKARLHHGDVLRIGSTEFLYNDPTARRTEPLPPPSAPPPMPPPPPPPPAKKPIRLEPGRGRPRRR